MKRKKVKLLFVSDKSQMKSTKIDCYPTINSLCSVIPRETREHMHRVGDYSEILFRFIYDIDADRIHKELGYEFEKYSKDIFKYHDIGRVYIPFAVLNKVERLTDEEFHLIKDHTINVIPAMDSIYKKPFNNTVMKHFMNVALYHHERWDGNGYPKGLKGEEIPYEARICAIADTYDGITSWKPYKKKQTSKEEAIEIITKESGRQFDPELVDLFRASMKKI